MAVNGSVVRFDRIMSVRGPANNPEKNVFLFNHNGPFGSRPTVVSKRRRYNKDARFGPHGQKKGKLWLSSRYLKERRETLRRRRGLGIHNSNDEGDNVHNSANNTSSNNTSSNNNAPPPSTLIHPVGGRRHPHRRTKRNLTRRHRHFSFKRHEH